MRLTQEATIQLHERIIALLKEGKSYLEVIKELNTSSATIAIVKKKYSVNAGKFIRYQKGGEIESKITLPVQPEKKIESKITLPVQPEKKIESKVALPVQPEKKAVVISEKKVVEILCLFCNEKMKVEPYGKNRELLKSCINDKCKDYRNIYTLDADVLKIKKYLAEGKKQKV